MKPSRIAAKKATEISERVFAIIGPEIADLPPTIQGAVLADITALWLAGHHVPNNPAATDELRADLFADYISTVMALTRVNAKLRSHST